MLSKTLRKSRGLLIKFITSCNHKLIKVDLIASIVKDVSLDLFLSSSYLHYRRLVETWQRRIAVCD